MGNLEIGALPSLTKYFFIDLEIDSCLCSSFKFTVAFCLFHFSETLFHNIRDISECESGLRANDGLGS